VDDSVDDAQQDDSNADDYGEKYLSVSLLRATLQGVLAWRNYRHWILMTSSHTVQDNQENDQSSSRGLLLMSVAADLAAGAGGKNRCSD
jgi:hypothetical protein